MHDVAEILARLYVKNRRYTVGPLDFVASISSIIFFIVIFEMCKRGFLYYEIFQTEISFWGEHGVKKLV